MISFINTVSMCQYITAAPSLDQRTVVGTDI